MERINKLKILLWIIVGMASAVAVTRFIFGLGVTTNLNDNTPWGFWIGFDVMGGVALAAGGFVIASFNYIFQKKEFHSITRAAILTAFLGYIAVAMGLLFDLGLPWNIWHMIIYWNPKSPLFEVGWCVMLYLTVLTLEFAPVVLEKFKRLRILSTTYQLLSKIKIPLVILGIMLSTLHQSSLGSLFLVMPYKLHPLWYSPILPVIFFISAICLGIMMVMLESMTSSYLYNKRYEMIILNKLKFAGLVMICIYSILRFSDIIFRNASVFLFEAHFATILFWIEILFSIIIPLIIYSISYKRLNINLLYLGTLTGVFGIVFNRLNVGGMTHLSNFSEIGEFYFPSWMELCISGGVVSVAMLAYFYFVENFRVWDEKPFKFDDSELNKLKFNYNKTYFGTSQVVNRTKFSMVYVLAFAFSFAAISGERLDSEGIIDITSSKARGGDTLYIDGNRDNYGVYFDHLHHVKINIGCNECHHLNAPKDKTTGCYECHYNMYSEGDMFNHGWHTSSDGAGLDCFKCHTRKESKGKTFRFNKTKIMRSCVDCHNDIIPLESKSKRIKTYKTLSYVDAMHNLCVNCHQKRIETDKILLQAKPDLARCRNCHKDNITLKNNMLYSVKNIKGKWVVIPTRLN